jgi:hypothetical protein
MRLMKSDGSVTPMGFLDGLFAAGEEENQE